MEQGKHEIDYTRYHREELSQEVARLCNAAQAATGLAYAPYSKFKVGAAAQLAGGRLVHAANLENAAYPQCLCAEATLLGTLHTQHAGERIVSIAIAIASAKPRSAVAAPCGSCRQQLHEAESRQGSPIELYLVGPGDGVVRFGSVKDLLPFGFSLDA